MPPFHFRLSCTRGPTTNVDREIGLQVLLSMQMQGKTHQRNHNGLLVPSWVVIAEERLIDVFKAERLVEFDVRLRVRYNGGATTMLISL